MGCDFYIFRVLRIKGNVNIDIPLKFKQFYYLPIKASEKYYDLIRKTKMKEMETTELIFSDDKWLIDDKDRIETYTRLLQHENLKNGYQIFHHQYAVEWEHFGWPI